MGVCMKKLFVVFGLFICSLFCSANPTIAKNDTVVITNRREAISFNAYFCHVFSNLVKDDMRKMREADPEKFDVIRGEIQSLVIKKRTSDANSIIPILKQHGSLRHIINYKKIFHFYFEDTYYMNSASSVFYIIDEKGNFLYVELKDIFHKQNLVFDQALLKNVRVNKDMLSVYMKSEL